MMKGQGPRVLMTAVSKLARHPVEWCSLIFCRGGEAEWEAIALKQCLLSVHTAACFCLNYTSSGKGLVYVLWWQSGLEMMFGVVFGDRDA